MEAAAAASQGDAQGPPPPQEPPPREPPPQEPPPQEPPPPLWEAAEAAPEGPEEGPADCSIGTLADVNQKIVRSEQGFESYHNANTAMKHLEFSKRYSEKKSSGQEESFPGTPKDKAQGRRKPRSLVHKCSQALQGSEVDVLAQSAPEQGTVETYQYPGFNKYKLTPLPNGVVLRDVVEKTLRAQRNSSSGKSLFPTKTLRNFLTSPLSQAVLVDSFWWLFLHFYQPNAEIEQQLFERIARSYALLLLDSLQVHHQEAFVEAFPSLLSQALYVCFCSGFPRSHFNTDEFKSQLCNIISEWMAGTRPVPQNYNNWDYSQLEPERFKMSNLESPKGKHGNNFFKASSSPENTHRHRLPQCKELKHGQASSKYQPHQTSKDIKPKQMKVKAVTFPDLQTQDAKLGKDQMESWKETQHMLKTMRLKAAPHPRESHPACHGPDFTWHLFNINGHSPLVHHYLQSCNAEPRSGQDILIRRREISNPTPASTPTYADLIQESFRRIHTMNAAFREVYQRHCREIEDFNKKQQKEQQEFLRKKKQLLQESRKLKNLK